MNLIEATIKLIENEKYKINELSDRRRDIRNDLKDGGKNVISSLICIFIWENSNNNLNHWKEEVFAGLSEISLMKPKNQYPTFKQLKSIYLDTQLQNIDKKLEIYVSNVIFDEKREAEKRNINFYLPDYDTNKMRDFIKDYFNWLYLRLSEQGILDKKEVYQKIDFLLKEYK